MAQTDLGLGPRRSVRRVPSARWLIEKGSSRFRLWLFSLENRFEAKSGVSQFTLPTQPKGGWVIYKLSYCIVYYCTVRFHMSQTSGATISKNI